LFKIFEDYTIEDVPSAVKSEMITTINTEGTSFNSFLLHILEMLTEAIEGLEEDNVVIASSTVEYILAFGFTAKTLSLLIKYEGASFKIATSELESININCKSILNAVDRIKKLQTTNIKKLEPEELLVVLTT